MLGGRSRAVFFLVLGLLLLGYQANAEQDEGPGLSSSLSLVFCFLVIRQMLSRMKVNMENLKRWKWRWVQIYLPVLRQTRPMLGIPWTTLRVEEDILKSVQILSIAR